MIPKRIKIQRIKNTATKEITQKIKKYMKTKKGKETLKLDTELTTIISVTGLSLYTTIYMTEAFMQKLEELN